MPPCSPPATFTLTLRTTLERRGRGRQAALEPSGNPEDRRGAGVHCHRPFHLAPLGSGADPARAATARTKEPQFSLGVREAGGREAVARHGSNVAPSYRPPPPKPDRIQTCLNFVGYHGKRRKSWYWLLCQGAQQLRTLEGRRATLVEQRLLPAGKCATAAHPWYECAVQDGLEAGQSWYCPVEVRRECQIVGRSRKSWCFSTFCRRPCRFDAAEQGDRRRLRRGSAAPCAA